MTAVPKLKLSVTISRDLVERIDREARAGGGRSRVIERWLRQAARLHAERDLERTTVAYYQALTDEDRAEDEAIAQGSTRAARRLDVDGPAPSVARGTRSSRR
jgi:metal-responsive CopG/Arc/MetJ family transcriptional regulator